MKFKVTMKDPDGVQDSIQDAVEESVKGIAGLSDDEREAVAEKRQEELSELIGKWFEYSEYLTVEIDTDAQSITVCAAR